MFPAPPQLFRFLLDKYFSFFITKQYLAFIFLIYICFMPITYLLIIPNVVSRSTCPNCGLGDIPFLIK